MNNTRPLNIILWQLFMFLLRDLGLSAEVSAVGSSLEVIQIQTNKICI